MVRKKSSKHKKSAKEKSTNCKVSQKKLTERRDVSKLMSKSVNVFFGHKSEDGITNLESPLEADFCYHLEYDQSVKSYQAQPLPISYFYDGKSRIYTPDFKVTLTDGSIIYYEIKFEEDIERIKDFELKNEEIIKVVNSLDAEFEVITEEFIRKSPVYENLINLWSSINLEIDSSFLIKVIETLKQKQQATIRSLIFSDESLNEFGQIQKLIFEHKLLAPIDKEVICLSSVVQDNGDSYADYL